MEGVAEKEPFYERFSRVLQEGGLSDAEAAAIMGLSAAQISRIKKGQASSIRFEDGLKLCEKLGLDPWFLAFGRPMQGVVPEDRVAELEKRLEAAQRDLQASQAETRETYVGFDQRLDEMQRVLDKLLPPGS